MFQCVHAAVNFRTVGGEQILLALRTAGVVIACLLSLRITVKRRRQRDIYVVRNQDQIGEFA